MINTEKKKYGLTQHRKQQLMYLLFDLLAAVLVWVSFLIFRWVIYDERIFSVDTVLVPVFSFYRALLLYPIGCLIVYWLSGYYLRPFRHSLAQEFLLTFFSSLLITIVAFFLIVIDDPVENYQCYYVSFFVLWALQFSIPYLVRLSVSLTVRRLIKKGKYRFNVGVIGNKKSAAELSKVLTDKNVAVVISEDELDKFPQLQRDYELSEVVVAAHGSDEHLYSIISKVYPYHVEIYFPARVYDMLTGAARIQTLQGAPLVCITEHKMSDTGLSIKRACDIVVAAVSLLLLSPLFLLIAILIRCSSKGEVIYRQERIGLHGRPFEILKFRTMIADAEPNNPQLTRTDDPRVTRVGRWLRKYRIDELPQFWNVLRGDMSLVGPRPERQYYINQIVQQAPYYCLLYKIRPGLTSWGPIKVGYTDTIDKMIQRLNYDIVYMENMSLRLDIKILLYTIAVLVDGKGQ